MIKEPLWVGWDGIGMGIIGHRYSKITFGANTRAMWKKEKGRLLVCVCVCVWQDAWLEAIVGRWWTFLDLPSSFHLQMTIVVEILNSSWNIVICCFALRRFQHKLKTWGAELCGAALFDIVWFGVVGWSLWKCSWSVWNCTPTPIRGGGCCSKIWTTSLFSPGVRYSTDPNWSDTNMGHWTSQCYYWTLFLKDGKDRIFTSNIFLKNKAAEV